MRCAALTISVAFWACGPNQAKTDEPPPRPVGVTLADLEEITPATYPVEDGGTLEVVFTNFCEQPTQFGFTPDEGGPPIVWTIQPRQRQRLTIPKGYALRGRLEGTKTWTDGRCVAAKNGHHLTFNVDCETCTAGKHDPLERGDCVLAGTCVPEDDPQA